MGFDLSAVDAELEQLGRAPEDPLHLARRFAGTIGSLANVDDELSALAQVSGVPEPLYVTRPQRAPVSFHAHAEPLAAPISPPVSSLKIAGEAPLMPLHAASSLPPSAREPEGALRPRRRSSIPLPPSEPVAPSEPPAVLIAPRASEPPAAPAPALASDQLDSSFPTAMSAESSFQLPASGLESTPPIADSWRPQGEPAADSEPVREAVPLTQSQEIVLPDPIPREELSTESGELNLDASSPNSGSYSLPDAQPQRDEAASFTRSGSHEFANLVDDEVQDALEGSRPLSLGAPAASRATRNMDRDPDAEFDALLSEATDPRGIPVVSGELDTDDLLRGLEMDDLDMEEPHESEADQATHEADELARSLFEEAEPDNTEILDRASALAIEAQAPGQTAAMAPEGDTIREELSLDAELDSGELEIMLDDEPAPPPPPAPSKAPPPPPGAAEKRPSILGRFFGGKRDGE